MIPTYNQAGFVAHAVESALAQEWPDIEVIAADDASTDDTAKVLAKYEADPRFRMVRNQTNIGRVGNYRSLLYEHVRGDWVLNLDGDDYLCDNAFVLKAMAIVARDERVSMVIGRRQELHQPGDVFKVSIGNCGFPETMDGGDAFLKLPQELVAPYHVATMYRRADALALDFYRRDIVSSDWESLFRLMLGNRVGFVPDVVAVWRLHGTNTVSMRTAEDRIANLEVILGPYEHACAGGFFKPDVIDGWRRAMLMKKARIDAYKIIKSGQVASYKSYLKRIHALDPSVASSVSRMPGILVKRLKWFITGGQKS
jgi:glycosyltransferase involved in cell wall biosynthesis